MAARLLQHNILEYLVPLEYKTVGIFSDNTPTVAWATKLCAKKSTVAGRLLRALALRHHVTKSAPAVTASIPEKDNIRADNSSRWFDSIFNKKYLKITNCNFLFVFNKKHKLQTGNWAEFRLCTELSSKVISELRGEQFTLASWTRIPRNGGSIGRIGANMQIFAELAHTWIGQKTTQSSCSQGLQLGPDQDGMEMGNEVAFRASQTRWAPSQRQSKWEGDPVRSTENKESTCFH